MSIELLDPEPATSTALTVQQRAVQALGSDKARTELATLAAKSVDIKVVNSQAGRDQAHAAGMVLKRARVDIETRGKAARDDATKFSKAVIAEEKALVAIIEPEEQRVLGLRDAWDEARAAEKAEAERLERARIEGIQLRLADIRECAALALQCRTSQAVQDLIDKMTAAKLEGFEEFSDEAVTTRDASLARMKEIHGAKLAEEQERARVAAEQEAERQRLAAERAELDRQRQEAAAQTLREAQERAAAEAKAKAAQVEEEARLRAERDAHEAEMSRQRAELEAQQRAIREQQEALVRQQQEAARAAREEEERKAQAAREAEEAREAEVRRAAQAEADAAAAAERKRLDDEAAAARAEQERIDNEARAERQRKAEAEEAARVADKRKRDAADVMLGALQVVAATPRIPREVMSVVADAISCATGESA